MIATELQGFGQLLRVSAPYLIGTGVYTYAFLQLEERFGDRLYTLPGTVGSVFGLAVAFFLGFRMNSAYDRWWEARKILGELTNTTRSLVAKVYTYYADEDHLKPAAQPARGQHSRDLIDLTIAYVEQLTTELHQGPRPERSPEQTRLLERFEVNPGHKISNEILLAMSRLVESTMNPASGHEKSDLMQHLTRYFDIQGKAERIRNTPFLMIYGAFTRIVVTTYVLLLPLFIGDIDLGGEHSRLEWFAIPVMMVISTAFLTINSLANIFAEPFAERRTSVQIDTICATIVGNCEQVRAKLPQAELSLRDRSTTAVQPVH